MRWIPFLALTLLLASSPASAAKLPADSTTRDPHLPASESEAKAALESTPRHGEMVDVPYASGPIRSWIVYPERPDKAGVVIVIHEVFGLTDWIRGVTDQLAAEGFIAIAPDLISGMGPGGGGTDSVPSRDDVVKLIRGLSPEETQARLGAVRAYALALPAANGKLGTLGFCWGGGRSFAGAASSPAPDAAVVYYGAAPDSAMLLLVSAPVQGHYGGDDARINATIEPARKALSRLKRSYEPNVYSGAGHGFLRQQEGREGANLAATREAWPKTIVFLKKRLRS